MHRRMPELGCGARKTIRSSTQCARYVTASRDLFDKWFDKWLDTDLMRLRCVQMTRGNVGSLLVFDPAKITIDQPMKEAAGDAVVGIVTERGECSTLAVAY